MMSLLPSTKQEATHRVGATASILSSHGWKLLRNQIQAMDTLPFFIDSLCLSQGNAIVEIDYTKLLHYLTKHVYLSLFHTAVVIAIEKQYLFWMRRHILCGCV